MGYKLSIDTDLIEAALTEEEQVIFQVLYNKAINFDIAQKVVNNPAYDLPTFSHAHSNISPFDFVDKMFGQPGTGKSEALKAYTKQQGITPIELNTGDVPPFIADLIKSISDTTGLPVKGFKIKLDDEDGPTWQG